MKALGIVPPPKFSQATIVTATLLAAWILWLAANNRLCTYYRILLGQGGATTGGGSGATSNPLGLTFGNAPFMQLPYPFNQGQTATQGAAATAAAGAQGGVTATVPQN